MRVFKTKWFERFSRKNDINNLMLLEAVDRSESGLIDADLGHGVIKQRVARTGQGRSKGYRTIIIMNRGEKYFFVYGFPKNERDNLRQDEEEEFRNMAGYLLSLADTQLSELLDKGDFMEVKIDDKEI
ncbi:type II toxin-antitoxin system RelE/ParE family toxin [Candidatus Paracaedibacter symbiosus]|uniref:type II toxin-antitoxin system RelE/ParE family toxin n=1 Tax=Candidatus Paracaedibacter symbiosus TaxID=244582 RepID=UPI000509C98D|nr:type II toxin-antitoxin system RelE/ParE family toxin [Candidatus Paracaedibacter symbiosus]